jgi:lipoprotein NlpI
LRKALAIFPDYMEAHNDLGVLQIQQGAYDQAAAELQEAVK